MAAHVEERDAMTQQMTFVKTVTREAYGQGTRFVGGTVLPNGRPLMADGNNRRLVQLDEEYNMVKEYELDAQPTDVAAGFQNNDVYIAVDLGIDTFDTKYIYKCVLDTGLKVVNKMKAPKRTCGIDVSGDNIIVCTFDTVEILNQDGTTLKSIPKSGDNCYVAVSQKQRTIYHRDGDDIVCRTLEGRELFRYGHQELEYPRGISTDTHGCAYICGNGSFNVHQVSPDGKKSKIINLRSIAKPWNCLFLPQQNELLVTSDNENTVLEVCKLK